MWEDKFVPIPNVKYNIGERVRYGAFDEAYVLEKSEDNRFYVLKLVHYAQNTRYEKSDYAESTQKVNHLSIAKYVDRTDCTNFAVEETHHINYINTSLSSLFSYKYLFGLNDTPDYQRGLVWTIEDNIKLIESIFNNVDIGKFVFIRKPYGEEYLYEVLDGKQRLNAIFNFYENEYGYKGCHFCELSPRDIQRFENHPIVIGTTNMIDKKDIYSYFLKLNISGKRVSEKHLEYVKSLRDKL